MASLSNQTSNGSTITVANKTPKPFETISGGALQPKIAEFWDTLSAKETKNVFVRSLQVLGRLIKQLAAIFSLLILAIAVFVVWFWSIGYQAGLAFKSVAIDMDQPGERQIVNGLVRLFLIPVRFLADFVEHQAKVQFGKEFEVPLPDLTFQLWKPPQKSSEDAAEENTPEENTATPIVVASETAAKETT